MRQVALLGLFGVTACAARLVLGAPAPLRRYEVLVPGQDSLSRAVAAAFQGRGFSVRDRIRGGSRPTAAYVAFRFSDPGAGKLQLMIQLADTRRGTVLAAATIPADTLAGDLPGRAALIVGSLLAP